MINSQSNRVKITATQTLGATQTQEAGQPGMAKHIAFACTFCAAAATGHSLDNLEMAKTDAFVCTFARFAPRLTHDDDDDLFDFALNVH